MNEFEVVKSIKTINSLIKAGLVVPHEQTGTKITGLYDNKKFTCYYIDSVPKKFIKNGYEYKEQYFSGCFCPYLVRRKID
jgi:hypothetical protein